MSTESDEHEDGPVVGVDHDDAVAEEERAAGESYDEMITRLARQYDAKWNERTRLHPDERLSVASIWVAEVYTPSTLPRLIRALRNLGWDRNSSRAESDLTEWVRNQRSRHSIAWTQAGFVVSPDSTAYYADRRAPLPASIKAMVPTLWSIPGGITVLSVQFFVDDDAAARLNPVLRRDYDSYIEPLDPAPAAWRNLPGLRQLRRNQAILRHHRQYEHARAEHDVMTQRRDLSQAELESLRRECTEWVTEWLPGKFADTDRDDFPTAVLIVTDKDDPFPEHALGDGQKSPRGFDFLGLGNQWIAFRSERHPAFGVVTPDRYVAPGFPLAHSSLTFAIRRDGAFMADTGHSTSEVPDDWLIAQRAGKYVLGAMVRWALQCQPCARSRTAPH